MKKIIAAFLLATVVIVGCKDKDKTGNKPPVVVIVDSIVPTGDTLKILPDVELFNNEKDAQVSLMKRKKPVPPPPPPPYFPPPVVPVVPEFCILLDFTGHNTTGTMWNTSGDIISAPSNLTTAQQMLVLDSVRSYFKVISGVYVTNSEDIFNGYAAFKRMRVVISPTYQWYGSGAGGVAYINSSSWGSGEPCFVFEYLLSNNARWISDAAAHESAHTMGLRHQSTWLNGVKTSEYNWGNAEEAPIEGASYNARRPKWWIGLNSIGIEQNDTAALNTTVKK